MRRTAETRLRHLPLPRDASSAQPELDVVVDGSSRPVRVTVHGAVDLASAAQLRAVLGDATRSGGDVILDCAGMSFIDACGLGVLAAVSHRLRLRGDALRLANPSPFLRSLLRITRLDALTQIEPPHGSDVPVDTQ